MAIESIKESNCWKGFFKEDVRCCNVSSLVTVVVLTTLGGISLATDDASDLLDDWQFGAGVGCLSVALLVSTSWACYLATKMSFADQQYQKVHGDAHS